MAATELSSVHEITPSDATTLTTWVTALSTSGDHVVQVQPQASGLLLQPKCENDNTDFQLIVYGYLGATWTEIGRLSWAGEANYNPVGTTDYRPAPKWLRIPREGLAQARYFALGRIAGTDTWTVYVSQDNGDGHRLAGQRGGDLKLTPTLSSKMVSTAGTKVALGTGLFKELLYTAKRVAADNTGNVFLGDSTLQAEPGSAGSDKEGPELEPGDHGCICAPPGYYYDLANHYLDADNANDGIVFIYWS